jgi:hypothetical protein
MNFKILFLLFREMTKKDQNLECNKLLWIWLLKSRLNFNLSLQENISNSVFWGPHLGVMAPMNIKVIPSASVKSLIFSLRRPKTKELALVLGSLPLCKQGFIIMSPFHLASIFAQILRIFTFSFPDKRWYIDWQGPIEKPARRYGLSV